MTTRPSVDPDWATDANHPAGLLAWNGQPNKVQPSAGVVGSGWNPGDNFAVEYENFMLNNHGNYIKYLDRIIKDSNLWLYDDFTGSALNTGLWSTYNAGLTLTSPTLANDDANGGSGVLSMSAASAHASGIASSTIVIGTGDFIWSARYRLVSGAGIDGGVSDFRLGLGIGNNGFSLGANGSVFQLNYNNGAAHFTTALSTSDFTNYHTVTVIRVAGNFNLVIDGAVVFSTANAFALGALQFNVVCIGSSTSLSANVDYMKLWVNR